MEQRLHLQQKQVQRLIMTPKMQQSIHLLQLSTLELTNLLQKEMVDNPLLEEDASLEAAPEQTSENSLPSGDNGSVKEKNGDNSDTLDLGKIEFDSDWEDYFHDTSDAEMSVPSGSYSENNSEQYEAPMAYSTTLKEHLKWQLEMSTETEEEQSIGLLIVEYLNDDGYLELTIDQILEMTGSDKRTVEKVLEKVQSFDPPGIAARDLAECLEIQCHFYDMDDPLLLEVIRYHLGDLERRRYAKLTRVLGVSEKQVQSIADTIATLDPKPGRKYAITENEYVTPDVFVEKIDGEYVVRVNDEGTPPLRISKRYRRMLENREELTEEAYEYIKNKFKSAMWLIRNIEQRKRTLYNVTKQIVQMQHDFLEHGITHLRPMRLRDVADAIGVHEATVCRVVNGKYVQTPRGLFELKFFFSTALESLEGEDQSAKSVMEMIRRIVEEEDPKKPYSDQKIADILNARGVNIARRTISKYREKMGILSTTARKRV